MACTVMVIKSPESTDTLTCITSCGLLWAGPCGKIIAFFYVTVMYVKNDTQNPYKMVILNYYEHVREMFYLDKYLPPMSKNNE